jgi:hypothetical protein
LLGESHGSHLGREAGAHASRDQDGGQERPGFDENRIGEDTRELILKAGGFERAAALEPSDDADAEAGRENDGQAPPGDALELAQELGRAFEGNRRKRHECSQCEIDEPPVAVKKVERARYDVHVMFPAARRTAAASRMFEFPVGIFGVGQ